MKKFPLSRRAFLKGAGATLALPALESLTMRNAHAQALVAPKRLVFIYTPNGFSYVQPLTPDIPKLPTDWTFAQDAQGRFSSLTGTLQPLDALKDQLLIFKGIHNKPAPPVDPHLHGTAGLLTGSFAAGEGIDVRSPSIDQLAAPRLKTLGGGNPRFQSLELGAEVGYSGVRCSSFGFSCAYMNNISWVTPNQPAPKETNPQALFDRMMGTDEQGLNVDDAARRRRLRLGILDRVKGDIARVQPRLSGSDRLKLDEYLTHVGALEANLQTAQQSLSCAPPLRPGDGMSYPARVKAMVDLMVLALQCDMTRTMTFMMGASGSRRVFDFLGQSMHHHALSHRDAEAWQPQLFEIEKWEMAQLAYFLQALKNTPDIDGRTVLDNTLVLLSSEVGDGSSHNFENMPVIVAGGSNCGVRPGRLIDVPSGTPLPNLFLGMLNHVGIHDLQTFGVAWAGGPYSTGSINLG